MNDDRWQFATVAEVAAGLRDGSVTSVGLTEMTLARIASLNGVLNAYVTVTADSALEQARRADAELASGARSRAAARRADVGQGFDRDSRTLTTGGSRVYEDWIPTEDATVVSRLAEAGAVLLGKDRAARARVRLDVGQSVLRRDCKPMEARSPHPGGSSGGSAASVAAGLAFASIGTDTGCSVRQPAQCCGIVGHKPTFGLVSKSGVIPLVPSMDHVGPLTRSVADAATVLQAIAGADPSDPHCVARPVPDFAANLDEAIEGLAIGVPRHFFYEDGDDEVCEIVRSSLDVFEYLGADLVDIDVPDIEEAYRAGDVTFVEIVESHGEAMRRTPELFSEPFKERYEQVARSHGRRLRRGAALSAAVPRRDCRDHGALRRLWPCRRRRSQPHRSPNSRRRMPSSGARTPASSISPGSQRSPYHAGLRAPGCRSA